MNNQNQTTKKFQRHLSKQSIINIKKEKIEKKFIAGSEVIYDSLKFLVKQQKEYGNKHSNYVLGIQTITDDKKNQAFTVSYDCDKSAIPLSKIQYSSPKHKIQIFKYLYLIYGFLNKEKILHRNIKPNNIIFYNQQLLLTDFGYKADDWLIDKINFLEENNDIRNNNMYPYLFPDIANIIISIQCQQEVSGIKRDFIINRKELSVKKQDQFAIAIMMLEVFIPLKNRQLTTTKERQQQINDMNLSDDFSNEVEKFIKETIIDLLYYKDFNEYEFEKRLKMLIEIEQQAGIYKINKQELMTQEYDYLVKEVLENRDTQFDLKLLYHFNIRNLIDCQRIANNHKNEELIEEIKRFQILYSSIDDLSLDTTEDHINQLNNEDLFILLVYLDQKIVNCQIQLPKHLNLLEKQQQYQNLNLSLKKQYNKLNNLKKNQFTFNKIIEKGKVDFAPIYRIDDQSNDYTSQQDLLETIISIFKNSSLQIYFEINKCLLIKKGWIYKHKDHPNVIYLGEKKDNVFEGEMIQFEEESSIKMISHYVHVQIQLDSWNIQDIEKQSLIYYYIESRTPQKFQKVKEYFGQIKNGKQDGQGNLKDFIENMIYIGQWREGQMYNQGIKYLMNIDQIRQNTPYKWEGNFEKNKLHGQNIKTYLWNYNDKEVWLEGCYIDGQQNGYHVCYTNREINQ